MNKMILAAFAALPMLLCGGELWSSKNWTAAQKNGAPNGAWDYDVRGGSAKFTPGTDKAPAFVALTIDSKRKGGVTLTCKETVKFPKGSELTISGEYRTINFVPGKKGNIWVNTAYNYQLKDQKWQLFFLKPTNGEWKKFSNSKKIDAEAVGSYRSYFAFIGESGTLEWRNLSLSVKTPAGK